MKLYRYQEEFYAEGHIKINKHVFAVIKETPKGYWIRDLKYNKRWVSQEGRKAYARADYKDAFNDFKARKNKQLAILNARVKSTKKIINMAKAMEEAETLDTFKPKPFWPVFG